MKRYKNQKLVFKNFNSCNKNKILFLNNNNNNYVYNVKNNQKAQSQFHLKEKVHKKVNKLVKKMLNRKNIRIKFRNRFKF